MSLQDDSSALRKHLEAEIGDEQIYVTISDNGPGIPASVRRTLFDPFVTAGKPNGTGLGLTLSWNRIQRGLHSR